jgi:cupin fold WbuC family metalloprotein
MIIIHTELDRLKESASKMNQLRINHNFHLSADSKSQRLLNALEPGNQTPIHKHHNTAGTYKLLRSS